MNNYERIKQMSVEDMAEFITNLSIHRCCYYDNTVQCTGLESQCQDGIKQWLLAECEE